jgi:hypothetical protein
MKPLTFLLFVSFVLISSKLFAQGPDVTENELHKSFIKIDYSKEDNTIANDLFAKKLKLITEKYPSTISQKFDKLKTDHMDISTSADGLFRIYSWDTWTGGTMHFFESVFQYKSGLKSHSILDTPKQEGDNRPNYQRIFTFKANRKTYYLCVYVEIGSSKDAGDGVHIFTIENGKLTDAKIIKTGSGLHDDLNYGYDFGSVVNIDYQKLPAIRFDNVTNTIYLPMVDGKYQMTSKFIQYKFTGRYFERLKG